MTRKIALIAGVAGLALTVPALAQKGDRGDSEAKQEQKADRGGGGGGQPRAERPQQAERQQQRVERQEQRIERAQRVERPEPRAEPLQRIERLQQRAERPQRVERQQQRAERTERQQQRAERPQRVERQQQRAERPQRLERQQRAERQAERRNERQVEQRIERQAERLNRQQQRIERNRDSDRGQQRIERREQIREARREDRQPERVERRSVQSMFGSRVDDRGEARVARFDGRGYRPVAPLVFTREMRPMESFASKFDDRQTFSIGERIVSTNVLAPVPAFFAGNYVDTSDYYHRYDDDFGYVYRIDRDDGIVRSLMPLFGGYGIGDPWPQTYYSSYVPLGYRNYYYDTPDYYYRNDGYGIYQVDAGTQLITALVSLVLGQGYGIGQALPASYSAYNVPLDYRASYADTDDSWYRYGDGFIYQVDPRSRQVAARYPLYSDAYFVGEQWPVAYPDYNIPYGYRSAYADSPQYHYRYANNGIYQVDPTNQMILALVALISGDQFAVGRPMPLGYDIYNVPVDYRDRWADSDDEYYRYANGYVYRVDDDSGLIEEAFPVYA